MIGRELSGRSYPQIGVSASHHGISHHGEDPENSRGSRGSTRFTFSCSRSLWKDCALRPTGTVRYSIMRCFCTAGASVTAIDTIIMSSPY